MANAECTKILGQVVGAWKRWRSQNPDVRPDLVSVDLAEGKQVARHGAALRHAAAYILTEGPRTPRTEVRDIDRLPPQGIFNASKITMSPPALQGVVTLLIGGAAPLTPTSQVGVAPSTPKYNPFGTHLYACQLIPHEGTS
jgi:hypothetical protein